MKKVFFTLALVLGLLLTATAQERGLFNRAPQEGYGYDYSYRDPVADPVDNFGLPTQHGAEGDTPAPLGTGTALLIGLGAAYLVGKKHKRNTRFFLMAAVMLLTMVNLPLSVKADEGDELAKCIGTGSGYGANRTLTDSHSVGWVVGISQSGYLGANSADNHGIALPRDQDLPVVKAVKSDATTSTTGYYYYYTTTAVANVGSLEFSYTANSGNSNATAYVVVGDAKAAANGTAYQQMTLSNSSTSKQGDGLSTSGTFTYTFNETQTSARYYGFIIVTDSYKRMTSGTIKLLEGSSDGTYSVNFTVGNGATYVPNQAFPNASNSGIEEGTYTLPSATKTDFTFMGWNDGNNTYAAGANYTVSGNVTFTALWSPVIDVLNLAFTGVSGNSYSNWSNKTGTSGAKYAGNSAGGNSSIQLRNNSNSGVITTTSGGTVKKVSVSWNNSTSANRTLHVYGKNTAYSATSDLYADNTKGTLIGTIVKGTSTVLNTTDNDYKYIGLWASDGAMYLSEIDIAWEPDAAIANPAFSVAGGTYVTTQSVTLSCATANTTIYYTTDGSVPTNASTEYTSAIQVSTTTQIKAIAYDNDDDNNTSNVATATYVFLTPKTSIQQLYEDATTSSTLVAISFDDWVVTGHDGGTSAGTYASNAYLSDGTEYGCVINGTKLGFNCGDKLSGTVLCNIQKTTSNNLTYVKIINLTPSTANLTVTTGGSVVPIVKTIAELTGSNIGSVFTINNITYTNTNTYFQDAEENKILYSQLNYNASSNLANGKKYDISGVFIIPVWSSISVKRISPRESGDIVLKADMSDTDFSGLTSFSYIYENGPSTPAQHIKVLCDDLGTNKLTVTAPTGYEVCLSENGTYTSSVEMTPSDGSVAADLYIRLAAGLEADEYNGNLSFTADNLTTVNVALEGLVSGSPTFTINLTQPLGGIATISSDVAITEEGETVILSYSDLDDCYTFDHWTVLKDDLETEVEVTNNQFTMPNCNVLVEATFNQKTFTVNYSVNGTVYEALKTTGIECGDEVTLKTASNLTAAGITLPTGYSFTGWSTNAGSSETISSYIPTDNATLYAVLVQSGVSLDYVKVTEDLDDWTGDYLIVYETDKVVFDGSLSSLDGGNNVKTVTITSGVIESNATVDAYRFSIASVTGGYSIKSASGYYIGSTSYANELITNTGTAYANSLSINNSGNAVINGNLSSTNTTLRFNSSSGDNNYRFRYYKSGQQDIQLYKKQSAPSYTLIEDITSPTATLPSIEPSYLITVENGGVLTLTGPNNGDASNLIVKDGGQLITSSTGVQATVKKSVTHSNSKDAENWYTISSPVNNPAFNTVTNLTSSSTNGFEYDLYRYDEPTMMWENSKNTTDHADFTTLQNGRGYLYWNSTGEELAFVGELNAAAVNYTLTYTDGMKLRGFNLIGNPFSHNIYKGAGTAIENSKSGGYALTTGFYFLKNDGAWQAGVDNTTAIAPAQGILVQATTGGELSIANTNAQSADPGKRGSDGLIVLTVSNKQHDDVAYVQFANATGLKKIEHLNDEVPMLYIHQNDNDYAIATVVNELTGEMPVHFKANADGQYTISVSTENVEMGYLHLIDTKTNADVDLMVTPSYSFNAKAGDNANRFRLVFNATGVDENQNENENENENFAFISNGQIIVNGTGTLEVIDMLGRQLLSREASSDFRLPTSDFSPGVYVLRLTSDNKVRTQKIIIK